MKIVDKAVLVTGANRGVGRAVARRARGFGMKLLYHDPVRLAGADEQALDLAWVPFDALLAQSDFVSVNARLTPETRQRTALDALNYYARLGITTHRDSGAFHADEPAPGIASENGAHR